MQKIIILDLGSPTTQVIGRRVRELNTFCEVLPYNKYPEDDKEIIGLILSGSKEEVDNPESLQTTLSRFWDSIPVLSIAESEQPTVDELKPFVLDTCGSRQDWTPANFVETTVSQLKEQIGNDRVILGLSGGVDSSVTAVLLNRAIGDRLTCIFVDHGLLRKNEFEDVLRDYECLGLNVIGVDAKARFYGDLAGVTDPEQKRKIIGRDFVEVFNEEAKKITDARWLGQGTIYPDIIESVNNSGKVIKSHHNVGGLPKEMNLKLCEPLKLLFKDEVRRIGRYMGVPEHLIGRHPFPGPGLGVRILGDITPEKVQILQEADAIYVNMLREWVDEDGQTLYNKIWQAGAILLSTVRSTGMKGDERTYEHPVALRAVMSVDAMTADWVRLPYEFMAKCSNEIINKVKGVNRVCYDISAKPPATIEWE